MEAKARNGHHGRGRSAATIQWKMKLPLESIHLTFCSVFRPAKCGEWPLQEAHIFWGLAKKCELVWELRQGSHRPPCSPARIVARVQCFPQSSRLRIGAAPYPLCSIHRFGIVTPHVSTDCDQDVMDSLLVDVAIVAEPPDCSRSYFEFMAFIKSHQCVRVFWVHRQTPETLPVSKIRNYFPRPYGYLLCVGHLCNFLPQGAPQTNVRYNPFVYNHQAAKLQSIMPLPRQVQPKSGPEKAFGIVLREIR